MECVEAELIVMVPGSLMHTPEGAYTMTVAGLAVADAEKSRRDLARARRNRSAQARSGMMRDLGMVRTRSGGWE